MLDSLLNMKLIEYDIIQIIINVCTSHNHLKAICFFIIIIIIIIIIIVIIIISSSKQVI